MALRGFCLTRADLGVSKDITADGAPFGIPRLISVAWDVESDVISGGGRCWNQT